MSPNAVWRGLRPLRLALRSTRLREGELYWVANGPERGLVFLYTSGHRRGLPSRETYERQFAGRPIRLTTGAVARSLPRGPSVPDGSSGSLEAALTSSADTEDVREALCSDLAGSGYEIGAGDRPTRVPAGCRVTYVDRFTFEEAADGSFAGKEPVGFVSVSIFESVEKLASIPDGSADFFVACHVLEHVADVVGALEELHRKLRAGGRIALVLPDGRHTFDAGRPVTTLEHFVADHLDPGRGELEHYLEHFRRAAREPDWIELGREGLARGRDIHRHVFTPDSTRELLAYVQTRLAAAQVEVYEPAHVDELRELYVRIGKLGPDLPGPDVPGPVRV